MAATKTSTLIKVARAHLNEPVANFWSDDELLEIARRGYTDMWAAINDLNQEHYMTVDTTHVTLDANATQLTGVPTDCFRVFTIEPVDLTAAGNGRSVSFIPRPYNHPDFIMARTLSAYDPTNGVTVCYTLTGPGGPNGAPTVLVAPPLTTQIALRFVYVPILDVPNYTVDSDNPIPGESSNAMISWIVAFARAKERDDHSPDPAWLSVYATEKQSLLVRMSPRQTQEPTYVQGMFSSYWGT